MATQQFLNNSTTTLSNSITDVATTIPVTDGTVFSDPASAEFYYLATIDDDTNVEVVKITDVTGNTLTVVRGQDSTSGTAFAAGVTIASRVTAGTLDRFVQSDAGGNARGTDAVNIQPSRGTDTKVASGQDGIAIGSDTTASATAAIAIGESATASSTDGVSIGRAASCTASNTVAIGLQSGTTGLNAICIGYSPDADGEGSIAIGRSAQAVTEGATAVGWDADADTGIGSTAIGYAAYAGGAGTIALGQDSGILSDYSCVLATGNYVSISGRATPYSVHIGKTDYSAAGYTTSLTGPDYLPLEHGTYIGGTTAASHHQMQATERTFFSPPVQAGVKIWTATTAYAHNEVITPSTPNGYSYYARLSSPYGGTDNSSSTEPTPWPTTNGATIVEGTITWVCVDLSNIAFYLPDYIRFIPTEVGFIGDADLAAGGTQPTISWGIVGTVAKWKSATLTTLLSGAYSREGYVLTTGDNTEGADNMSADIDTLGTGVKSGRIYWKGICVETLTA